MDPAFAFVRISCFWPVTVNPGCLFAYDKVTACINVYLLQDVITGCVINIYLLPVI